MEQGSMKKIEKEEKSFNFLLPIPWLSEFTELYSELHQ